MAAPHRNTKFIKVSGIPSGKKLIKTIWYRIRNLSSRVENCFSARDDKFLISKRSHTCNFPFISVKCSQFITTFVAIFWRFPTTFWRFPKIFQNWSKGQMNVSEHFPKISEHFQKIAEDDSKMFPSCTNKFK